MSSIQEVWHPPHGSTISLLQAAAHVCTHNGDNSSYAAIANFLHKRNINIHHKPVLVLGKRTIYCVYHSGNSYAVYVMGDPETVLQASRMSDNDREKSQLEIRRLLYSGAQVLSVAHGTATTAPNHTGDIKNLTYCGHISLV